MYSLVLMAAIGSGPGTAGADQPAAVVAAAPIVVTGCTGCTGCTGYVASCNGCCGGGHHFLGHKHSCHGCCGGTVVVRSHGCCGGFLGHKHSCHGCCGGYSCFGSCSGFVTQSAWGNCHGCCGGFGPTTYYYPAYSTPILTGAAPFYYVGPTHHAAPPVVVPPAKTDEPKKDEKKGASLKFNLPAGAALYVDGVKTPGEGEERSFFTPPLEAGQKFFYDVRAELLVDGKTVMEEKRVIVEAGAEIAESFPKMLAAVSATKNVASK
jgi:uncharacterized protein (TIGR03000 family)